MSKPIPDILHKRRGRSVLPRNRPYHDNRTLEQDAILIAANKYKVKHKLKRLCILDMVEVLKEMEADAKTYLEARE